MAKYRYFIDTPSQVIEVEKAYFESRQRKMLGFVEATQKWEPITRSIRMKSFPSKHECDARCMNATGRSMQCECKCGGKNHGRGSFISEAC